MTISKTDCLEYLTHRLAQTANWRRTQAEHFPTDNRNALAAAKLDELASTADDIPDIVWDQLAPFYNPTSSRWLDRVS